MCDLNSKQQFLVDTGADLSVLPPLKSDNKSPSGLQLTAANGSVIQTYGQRLLTLDFGLRRPFSWKFVVADVSKPIIGADLLFHYNLMPDLRNSRLVDAITSLSTQCMSTSEPSLGLKVLVAHENPFARILTEFPDIIRPKLSPSSIKHNVTHRIITNGHPVFCRKARVLPKEKYEAAKKEYDFLCKEGFARPSDSEWSSALHMVPKPSGDWRLTGDYRRLNAITIPDRYPIPNITDLFHRLPGSKVFSKIDLVKAFYQIRMHPESISKTAILTPFGLFEHLFMPFGLRNAAQTFQRFMDTVLHGLDFVFIYIDDVLVFSKSPEQHAEHLRQVFNRLNEYGITINPSKCLFGHSEMDFIGFHITSQGITPLQSKVQAIKDYPRPEKSKSLQRFLGMINFYRPHIQNAAKLLDPLYCAINPKVKNHSITWTPELISHFDKAKQSLADAALLVFPLSNVPLSLVCDASDTGIGAVLQQQVDGDWQPLAFYSKKLDARQQNYSTYDRELLAIYSAIRHFHNHLDGRCFHVLTDHKPLTFAFTSSITVTNPRRCRHLDYISQFTTDIRTIKGSENVVADALSRIESLSTSQTFIDFEAMSGAQTTDADLIAYR